MHHWRLKKPSKKNGDTDSASKFQFAPSMEEFTGHWKYNETRKRNPLDQSVSAPVSPSRSRAQSPIRAHSTFGSPVRSRGQEERLPLVQPTAQGNASSPAAEASLPSFQWGLQHTQAVQEQSRHQLAQPPAIFSAAARDIFTTSTSAPVTPVHSRPTSPTRFNPFERHQLAQPPPFVPVSFYPLQQSSQSAFRPTARHPGSMSTPVLLPHPATFLEEEPESQAISSAADHMMDVESGMEDHISPRSRVSIKNLVSSSQAQTPPSTASRQPPLFTRQRSFSDVSEGKRMSINNLLG